MGETTLEVVAVEFLSFLFGVGEKVISTFVFWWIAYILFRFLLKNIVFKDNEPEWKRFASSVRLGVEELADAFLNAMYGVAVVAKQWAREKKEEAEW